MLRAPLASALLLPLLLACAGCHHETPTPTPGSGGPAPSADAAPASDDTVVRLEDDGKTLEVSAGKRIVFKLASNSGTGYVWTPAPVDATILVQQGEREVERTSDLPGGSKLDVLRFAAKGPGTVTVQVDLKRPWGDQPVAKTLKVTVTVR